MTRKRTVATLAAVALAGGSTAAFAAGTASGEPAAQTAPTARSAAGDDGLTYAQAVRAERAAKARVKGIATSIDADRDGTPRYEVEVLRRDGREYVVALDSSMKVVSVKRDTDDD